MVSEHEYGKNSISQMIRSSNEKQYDKVRENDHFIKGHDFESDRDHSHIESDSIAKHVSESLKDFDVKPIHEK